MTSWDSLLLLSLLSEDLLEGERIVRVSRLPLILLLPSCSA